MINKELALFDFDGTISFKDSMFDFILFSFGKKRFYLAFIVLSFSFFKFFMKIIDSKKMKRIFINYFLINLTKQKIYYLGNQYYQKRINSIIRKKAIDKINWHKSMSHDVYIVSASLDIWLYDWAKEMNIKLISTRLGFKGEKYIGHFDTQNCNGLEKLKRIKCEIDLENYSNIYAYGDSNGDKNMFSIANQVSFKPFR
jgi:HAD superfamily hydrolase (TIGR01490 family)